MGRQRQHLNNAARQKDWRDKHKARSDATAATGMARLDNLHHQAMTTGNRVYVWHAVSECLIRRMPLPGWCLEYLLAVALNVCDLANGVDFRKPTAPSDQETTEKFRMRLAERYMSALDSPEISPERALRCLGQAMLLSGRARNQFLSYRSNEQAIRAVGSHIADTLLDPPPPGFEETARRRAAARATADPPKDSRQARRQIAKGKRLFGPAPASR
jgi:hypothetical protein